MTGHGDIPMSVRGHEGGAGGLGMHLDALPSDRQ